MLIIPFQSFRLWRLLCKNICYTWGLEAWGGGILKLSSDISVEGNTWTSYDSPKYIYTSNSGVNVTNGYVNVLGNILTSLRPDRHLETMFTRFISRFILYDNPKNGRYGVLFGNFLNTSENAFNVELTIGRKIRIFIGTPLSGEYTDFTTNKILNFNQEYLIDVILKGRECTVYLDGVDIGTVMHTREIGDAYLDHPYHVGSDRRNMFPFCGGIKSIELY